jgi:hypothetical protein
VAEVLLEMRDEISGKLTFGAKNIKNLRAKFAAQVFFPSKVLKFINL